MKDSFSSNLLILQELRTVVEASENSDPIVLRAGQSQTHFFTSILLENSQISHPSQYLF